MFDRQVRHPALLLRSRHGYAVDLHRDLPGQTCGTLPGVPRPLSAHALAGSGTHRTPAHIRRVGAGHEFKRPQHRFLTYAFSSCSPGPTHPAVLDRPDFVAAAPALPDVLRLRLPPASLRRYDGGATKASHLHSNNQRLAAHHRKSQCQADGVDWLAPPLISPSWLVSVVRPVDTGGPADLA